MFSVRFGTTFAWRVMIIKLWATHFSQRTLFYNCYVTNGWIFLLFGEPPICNKRSRFALLGMSLGIATGSWACSVGDWYVISHWLGTRRWDFIKMGPNFVPSLGLVLWRTSVALQWTLRVVQIYTTIILVIVVCVRIRLKFYADFVVLNSWSQIRA